MDEDISKNTLLVLVALTIIISGLGTWTVISEANKVVTQQDVPEAVEIPSKVGTPTTTGRVVLNIVPGSE